MRWLSPGQRKFSENAEVRHLERMDRRTERVLAGGPVWSDFESLLLAQQVREDLESHFGTVDDDDRVAPEMMVIAVGFWPSKGEPAVDRGQSESEKAHARRYYYYRDHGLEIAHRARLRQEAREVRERVAQEARAFEADAEARDEALEALAYIGHRPHSTREGKSRVEAGDAGRPAGTSLD